MCCPRACIASATTGCSPTAKTAPPISLAFANCSPCRKAQRSLISIPTPIRWPPRSAKPMPMLRWPHDHHRDLRARLSAQVRSGSDQDRHLMTPSPLTHHRPRTNRSRRRSTGNACALAESPILPDLTPQTSPRNATPTRQSPCSPAQRSPQPLQSGTHQASRRDQIPIVLAAPPPRAPPRIRAFTLSVAGRVGASIASSCRRPKTCTNPDIR